MTITINLTASSTVRLGESIVLPEEVKIKFSSTVYALGVLVGRASTADGFIDFKTRGEEVDVSEICKKAGTVNISVSLVVKGEAVKTWKIETLYLKEIAHEVVATPEIEAMKERIKLLENAVIELTGLVKDNNTY
jgi:hypothetical protein